METRDLISKMLRLFCFFVVFYYRSLLTNAPVFLTDFPNMALGWRRVLNGRWQKPSLPRPSRTGTPPQRKNLWFKPVRGPEAEEEIFLKGRIMNFFASCKRCVFHTVTPWVASEGSLAICPTGPCPSYWHRYWHSPPSLTSRHCCETTPQSGFYQIF